MSRTHRVTKKLMLILVGLCTALLITVGPSVAATHFIRAGATGTASGVDWNNACTDFTGMCAASSLIRGDTYYVATGIYRPLILNTPTSGTLSITIKGAVAGDHGTDTGWLSNYGVDVTQATFSMGSNNLDISTSYWVIDGNTGIWGGPASTYGFSLAKVANCSNDQRSIFVHGTSLTNITVKRLSAVACDKATDTSRTNSFGSASSYITNLTVSNVRFDYFQQPFGVTNVANSTFEYLWLNDGFSSSANHGEYFAFNNCHNSDGGACAGGTTACTRGLCTTNNTIRYSMMKNCPNGLSSGTACIAALDPGNGDSAPNLKIYGNIFWGFPGSGGNGVIATGTSATHYAHNWLIYNNTFVNLSKTIFLPCVSACAFSTGNQFYNNLLYRSDSTLFGGMIDHNYNAWCSPNDVPPTENNGQTGCGDPFVSSSNGNFRLVSPTNSGLHLSSPYNIDAIGNSYGSDGIWDRGAYEFINGISSPPAPQNLKVM